MPQRKYFSLEIITPDRTVFRERVVQVMAPGKNGRFGVLLNHIPAMIQLTTGLVEAQAVSGNRTFTISGGIAEIRSNVMKILAESAEDTATIDVARAEQARQRAQQRLREKQAETDMRRAHASLARALNRISATRRHIR